ncbi:hypothetical protein LTR97_000917 [Elasticomyces elasticus]|uniref:Uncharacterized protein n=1 Tax=Elasticomyces elasticus TaxID=574655 RepID=A0AAN7ZR54_9PEZI|nr:hypothetical protein LTR97_000917 [Elasticomyces elasticus]
MSDASLADLIQEKAGKDMTSIVAYDILPLFRKLNKQRYTQKEYQHAVETVGGVSLLDLQDWGHDMLLPLWILMEHSNSSLSEKRAAICNAVRVRKKTPNALDRHVAECIESDIENAHVLDAIVWEAKQAGEQVFLSDIDIRIELIGGRESLERLVESSDGNDMAGMFSSVSVDATESPKDNLWTLSAQSDGGSSVPARKQVGQAAYGNGLGNKTKNAKKASQHGGQARSEDASPQAGAHAADSTLHGIGPGYIRKRGENKNDGEPITRADPKVDEALAKSMDGMGGFGKKPAAEDGADAARDNRGSQSASESSGATSGKHQAEMNEGKILTSFDQQDEQRAETGPVGLRAGTVGEKNGLAQARIEQEAEDGEVIARGQPLQPVAEAKQDAMMDVMEEGEIGDLPSKEKTEQNLAMSTLDGDDDAEGEGDESEEESEDSGSEHEADDSEDDGGEVEDSEEDGSEDDGSEGEDDTSEAVEEDDADDSEQDDTANDNSDPQSRIDVALKTTELGSIIAATAARNVVGGEPGSETARNPGTDEAANVVDDNSISQQAGKVADHTVNANMHNAASDVANAGQLIDSDDDSQHGKTATTQVNVEDVEMSNDELADNPHGAMTANGGTIGGVSFVQDHQQKEDDDDVAEVAGAGNAMGNLDVYGKMKVKTQNLWWNRGLPMRVVRMCGRRMWVHENERLASSSDLFGEFVFGGPFTAYYDSEKGVIHSIMPDGKLGPVVGPANFVGEGRWSDDFYGEKRKDFASPLEGSGRWRVFIR